MKQVTHFIISLFAIASANLSAAQPTIVTSQGTFVLKAPEECINSNCLSGVAAVAEMAGKALSADIGKANNEASALNTEMQSLYADYDALKADYYLARAPYDAKLNVYTSDLTNYKKDVDKHNGEVNVNNAKKPEDRNAAEVSRLNQNKAALDVRKSNLDSRKQVLDGERAVLMTKLNNIESKKNLLLQKQGTARSIADKINKALEQLQLCEEYGNRAVQVSKQKNWGSYKTASDFFGSLKIIPSRDLLNGSLEQMKNWSNKVWN